LARYGIGGIDHNLRAQIALMGLSEAPEIDIAELFESGHPIEPETRSQLAAALRGANETASLQLRARPAAKMVRKLRLRLKSIAIGRLVITRSAESGYGKAIQSVSIDAGTGTKSVESAHTLAMKAADWTREARSTQPHLASVSDDDLDAAFAIGLALGFAPEKVPHRLARAWQFAGAIRQLAGDAYGPRGAWFMRRKTDDLPPKT
jgi:hypothetical protein